MGYMTDYEVNISGFKDQDELEYFEFKKLHKSDAWFKSYFCIDGDTLTAHISEAKWYGWEKDILSLLDGYPHLTCIVEGVGEEFPDVWKAKIHGGKSKVVKAIITFPEFDEV